MSLGTLLSVPFLLALVLTKLALGEGISEGGEHLNRDGHVFDIERIENAAHLTRKRRFVRCVGVGQQRVHANRELSCHLDQNGQAQLRVARLDVAMCVVEMPTRSARASCERPQALRYRRMR